MAWNLKKSRQPDGDSNLVQNSAGKSFHKKTGFVLLSAAAILLIIIIAIGQNRKDNSVSNNLPGSSFEITASQPSSPNSTSNSDANPASTLTAPSAKSETPAESQESEIKLAQVTSSVSPGSSASVSIQGKPNTNYSIALHYSYGIKAPRLEDKMSDSNGIVSWTWKIDNKIKKGTCQIEITGADQTYPVDIEIQ